jgi:hypothetical protein
LLALGILTGCGDSNDGATAGGAISQAVASSYEGVYELTLCTENPTGCDSPGQDLTTSSDPYFLVVASELMGQWTVDMCSCLDIADCQSKQEAARDPMRPIAIGYGAMLSAAVSDDELTGFLAGSGRLENGMCVEREFVDYRLIRSGDTLHLEGVTKALAAQPPEDGICWARPEQDRQEAASAPCVSSRAVDGRRVSDL